MDRGAWGGDNAHVNLGWSADVGVLKITFCGRHQKVPRENEGRTLTRDGIFQILLLAKE